MIGSRSCIIVLIAGLTLLGGSFTSAHAQESSDVCERSLSAAEDQYVDAAYDEALRLVSACLNQGDRSDEQSVAAYRLLALIHLKRDELEAARAAVVNLLGVDPTYDADPVNSPPAYVSLVSIVQRDLESDSVESTAAAETERTPFFRRTGTWLTIGGIVVGSGVATYFAVGGGGGSGGEGPTTEPPTVPPPSSLPLPPGTP